MNANLPIKKNKNKSLLIEILVLIILILIYGWSYLSIDINWNRVFSEWTINNFKNVIPRFFEPDTTIIPDIKTKLLETLYIAFAGSLTAAVLAIPFGFISAVNITNSTAAVLGKWLLAAIRAFPNVILAILFVAAVGPTPLAGALAISIHSIGMLGKLYAEIIESIDMKVLESLEASGANKVQIFFYGIMPQVLPEFISFAIYRFEINVRASSILGLVGAGGIGTMIYFAKMNRNWEEVGMILISIIILVTIIDYTSAYIRKKLV
ncbi:phosphonate ABC transporter, permease protein PhnE [Haloplasma contractile]|uniref:Phosphonate ABC transporter permease protein n=1 Tax=Haloplasma contractile SSD-17B TaxID=1033810 RepID=F7Q0T5_9MOLU|nr:phosphonate ABC transporter, permease protein PhnE [Haloplasma contractile]ERJ11308.1 Phosphonate ABC transporter permease protein [Haloplasma contractile SSD-17B]